MKNLLRKDDLKGFWLPLTWKIIKSASISALGLWAYHNVRNTWEAEAILYIYAFIAFLAFLHIELESWRKKLLEEERALADIIKRALK